MLKHKVKVFGIGFEKNIVEPPALLRFVILATDGIWDVLSDKDSV